MIEIPKIEKSLEQKVHEYFISNEEKKKTTKVVSGLGPDIKGEVLLGDKEDISYVDNNGEVHSYTVEHRQKTTTSVNPSKLEAKLVEMGLDECFTTVRVVDETMVAQMIAAGTIDANALAECTDEKITGALYVKAAK